MDDFDDDGAHVFAGVDVDGGAVVGRGVEAHGGVDGLEEALLVDAGEDEARFVEAFGALGAGADAHGGEGMAHRCEEARLFRQGAAVGDHGGGVHLKAVVVVEAEGLVADHARVELEAAGLKAFARAGMAAVKDRHVVFRRQGVDGGEEAAEVFLGVDVLLAVRREEDVLAFLEAEAYVDVAGLDVGEIAVENFGHGRTGHVGAFLGQAAVGEVAARMLRVAEVYVGDDVDDAAVCLLGEAFVLAAVAGFHVEDGDVEALGGDGRQARVRVAQNEERVGLRGDHELVRAVDDVADGGAEVIAHGVHVHLGVFEFQVLEEHAVEVVVVVLPGMCQNDVEVLPALVDGRRQTDYLRPRPHDDKQLYPAVIGKMYVIKIGSH